MPCFQCRCVVVGLCSCMVLILGLVISPQNILDLLSPDDLLWTLSEAALEAAFYHPLISRIPHLFILFLIFSIAKVLDSLTFNVLNNLRNVLNRCQQSAVWFGEECKAAVANNAVVVFPALWLCDYLKKYLEKYLDKKMNYHSVSSCQTM